MRICHVSFSDAGGGAAIAALRLVMAQQAVGIDARLLVVERTTGDACVETAPLATRLRDRAVMRLASSVERRLLRGRDPGNPFLHSLNLGSRIDVRRLNALRPDLVHLHWINHCALSIEDVARIEAPLVWTLHDSWPVCGAEHHPWPADASAGFSSWYEGRPSSGLTRATMERKAASWKGIGLDFVAPSNWERDLARASALAKDNPDMSFTVIPNTVDSSIFSPNRKEAARRAMGFDRDTVVVGFGSAYPIVNGADPKGNLLFMAAMRKMKARFGDRLLILVVGEATPGFSAEVGAKTVVSGKIRDERVLANLYASCDVFACPSAVESFGLMAAEALLCGVPIAACAGGAIAELVENEETGFLSPPGDAAGLAAGLEWCIRERSLGVSTDALAERLSPKNVANEHSKLYSRILQKKPSRRAEDS